MSYVVVDWEQETTIQLQSKKDEETNKALHLFAFHYILLRCDIIFHIPALFAKNGNTIYVAVRTSYIARQPDRNEGLPRLRHIT